MVYLEPVSKYDSWFSNHLSEKGKAICLILIALLCLFLMVQWIGLHSAIVVFPGYTHLLSDASDIFTLF